MMPLGGILDRYISAGFLRVFGISLAVITGLYVTADFFERIGNLLESGAPVSTILRYFMFKAPLLISRVVGFATLFSTLFCLGLLARTQEITAIRSSGVSVQRIAWPLLVLALCLSGITFFWNETLVPIFSRNAEQIYRTEIRQKRQLSLFGTRDIWIRGDGSFINIDNFDPRTNTLDGVTVFTLNRDFSLRSLIEIPSARWSIRNWQTDGAVEWELQQDGKLARRDSIANIPITETPNDLKLLARDAEEYSFFDLQKQIGDMKTKGIDTTAIEVDLQGKLAIPVVSFLMVLLATPFAIKRQMSNNISLSFGIAMVIAFGYWVLTAFCISLGHSGAIPALPAAWIPNLIFSMIGLYFFTAEE
ncbi:MAG: LPS export ABC transporter permease LptG [Candidatus Binatia bacterium]